MSYYLFEPGQILSGCGAAGGIGFNGSQVGSDWNSCAAAWTKSQTVVPACQRAVDAIRAALGQLGYGGLGMGASWGSGDQAAYEQWRTDAGLSRSKGGRGMPDSDHMAVMERQLSAGLTPGGQPPIEYTKVGTEYVPTSAVTPQQAAVGWSKWGLLALGAAGVVAVAVVAGKKKKGKNDKRARPGLAGPPSAAAART